MEPVGVLLAFAGFASMAVGAWGVLRGEGGWPHLRRRASALVVVAGLLVFMIGGALLPDEPDTPSQESADDAEDAARQVTPAASAS